MKINEKHKPKILMNFNDHHTFVNSSSICNISAIFSKFGVQSGMKRYLSTNTKRVSVQVYIRVHVLFTERKIGTSIESQRSREPKKRVGKSDRRVSLAQGTSLIPWNPTKRIKIKGFSVRRYSSFDKDEKCRRAHCNLKFDVSRLKPSSSFLLIWRHCSRNLWWKSGRGSCKYSHTCRRVDRSRVTVSMCKFTLRTRWKSYYALFRMARTSRCTMLVYTSTQRREMRKETNLRVNSMWLARHGKTPG